jgi:hypothetical protein
MLHLAQQDEAIPHHVGNHKLIWSSWQKLKFNNVYIFHNKMKPYHIMLETTRWFDQAGKSLNLIMFASSCVYTNP